MTNFYSSHKKTYHGAKLPQRFWGKRGEEIKYTLTCVTDVNNLKFWATYSGYTIDMAIPNPICYDNTSGG